MYKVYFNRNTIVFPSAPSAEKNTLTIIDPQMQQMRTLVADCYGKGTLNIAFFSSTGQDLQKIFDSFFRHIRAAGGIVRHRPSGRVLMIRRWGRWDLPKGWQEPGETERENAEREVREETGLKRLETGEAINISRHAYLLDGDWTIKHTRWYAMTTEETQVRPQQEEGIEAAEWLDRPSLEKALRTTYPNIRETLEIYLTRYPLP